MPFLFFSRRQPLFDGINKLLHFCGSSIFIDDFVFHLFQVDVGGMMYFWGLTIDTVTSVMLILAIGLCVDYAAHIGHSFMTSKHQTRNGKSVVY